MDLLFKELDKSDIPFFMDLVAELKQEDAGVSFTRIDSPVELEKWLKDPQIYLYGAYLDGSLVGVFKATQGDKDRSYSCLIASALTNKCRGKGIGKKLLDYSLEQLQKAGIWMVRAYVYSNNTASFSTLLSAGFLWSGTVHKHHYSEKEGKFIDDLIFHKELRH